MAGSSSSDVQLNYGSIGIASATADPGARYQACSATSKSGPDIFFMFGGLDSSNVNYVGDFWYLDIATSWWTSIHQSNSQNFGLQGVASDSTYPGPKGGHTCATTSHNDLIYLFAGIGPFSELISLSFIDLKMHTKILCGASTVH